MGRARWRCRLQRPRRAWARRRLRRQRRRRRCTRSRSRPGALAVCFPSAPPRFDAGRRGRGWQLSEPQSDELRAAAARDVHRAAVRRQLREPVEDALNLTPDTSGLAGWTYEDFTKLIDTGVRKNGKKLDPFMPLVAFVRYDDAERHALWAYLQSLPPAPFGNR